jgi:hypothetical protein
MIDQIEKKVKRKKSDTDIRKAVSRSHKNPSKFFGKLKDGVDGLTYQRKVRNEWK